MENEQIIGQCGEGKEREYRPGIDGLIEAMGPEGDTKNIWDPDNPDEVEAAKATYDRLVAKGYRAFAVTGKDGEKGDQIDKFDPSAGRMILCPPLQGG